MRTIAGGVVDEDIEKVQRWLAESAVALALKSKIETTADKENLKRYQEVQSWLLANPGVPLPLEILRKSPFFGGVDREQVVDLLEQRLRMELLPLRSCHSTEAMARRLVMTVREARAHA